MADQLISVVVPAVPAAKKRTGVAHNPRSGLYEKDVYLWAREQAEHIRAGRFDKIDLTNAADVIDDVGRREYDAVVSNLKIVLTHMLKWDFQSAKQSRSWANSIGEHRDCVAYRFDVSPFLGTRRDELLSHAYRLARGRPSRETKLDISAFPATCPCDWDAVMTRVHFPDQTNPAS